MSDGLFKFLMLVPVGYVTMWLLFRERLIARFPNVKSGGDAMAYDLLFASFGTGLLISALFGAFSYIKCVIHRGEGTHTCKNFMVEFTVSVLFSVASGLLLFSPKSAMRQRELERRSTPVPAKRIVPKWAIERWRLTRMKKNARGTRG